MMTDDSDTRKGASDMDAHEEFERCAWGEMSGAYEANFGRITVQASDALLSAANVKSGTALLEVACGTGNISNVARKAGAEVIGIDFVHGMITEAKRLHPHIDFRVGDAQALPFDDNTFDAVVCNFGVHHFSDPLRALNEAFRVLKVGGEYAFTVWSPPNDVSINFRQIIREAVDKFADVRDALPPGPSESYFASPENCLSTLEGVGFTEISTSEIPLIGTWARAEEVLKTIYRSMARSKTLIEAQSPLSRRNIESEIVERAREYVNRATVEIPMPAMLTKSRKT